uniref:Protein kinase domain-containing protein n=1 Tax=Leptobrachium leishanense TaxID=445787 RepID=A0A8C5R3C8_9ANUR
MFSPCGRAALCPRCRRSSLSRTRPARLSTSRSRPLSWNSDSTAVTTLWMFGTEDLRASYQRRMEMEQKIEEMERMLKEGEQKVNEQGSVRAAGPALCSQEAVAQCETEGARCLSPDSCNSEVPEAEYNVPAHKLPRQDELGRAATVNLQEVQHKQAVSESWSAPSSGVPFTIFESCDAHPSSASVLSAQSIHQTNPMCADAASSSNVPFTIFDESCDLQPHKLPKDLMPPPVRRPLATSRSKAWSTQEHSLIKDDLDGVETLKDDTIVWGCQNKSLTPEPEDTSEFARAAQLASTPFHNRRGDYGQSVQSNTSDVERLPLSEKTPVCEESYRQEQCIKKLSPILEASQEDGRSSTSSVSSVSSASNSTSTFQSKTLPVADHFNMLAQINGVCELSEEPFPAVELTALHRQLLEPMYDLWASRKMQCEAEQLPVMKDQAAVTLGGENFCLKREIALGENTKLYIGAQVDHSAECVKEEVAIKVEFQPVPWDFYISSQLKKRLEDCYETHFLEQSKCYLFKDGCIMLYKHINSFRVEDSKEFINEVIVLVTYNLLDLVAKLHSAQIVHGDLRPDTLLSDDRIFNLPSEMTGSFKLIDFSSSMDLQLCPTMTSRGFPVAQTKHGQPFLAHRTSPYQVDLFGIADVVHLMIFRKHLQLQREESMWKIHEEIPNTFSYKMFFDTFFAKILNTDDGSTASVLQDLSEAMRALFDEQFQKKIGDYLFQLVMQRYV